MATLFPNVRGLSGEFRLAGAGAEAYAKSLTQLTNVTPASLSAKVGEINETPAAQATRELNKLFNFFKTDFGADLAKGMSILTKAVDPLLFVLPAVTAALPVMSLALGAGGAAWLAYSYRVRSAMPRFWSKNF